MNRFKPFVLSKKDTDLLKGLAMLLILTHNFFHWVDPIPGENEFDFSQIHIKRFLGYLSYNPLEFLNLMFSYLGHYGVQIFIFVSAYGLTKSYSTNRVSYFHFVLHRLQKLYLILVSGVFVFLLLNLLANGFLFRSQHEMLQMILKFTFLHTLIPGEALSITGPWWFFGVIFQLYLFFPFLYRLISKWGESSFVALCLISYILFFVLKPIGDQHQLMYMANSFAHLPEFALGILLALNSKSLIFYRGIYIAIPVFLLGNWYSLFFPFTFLAITLIILFFYQRLRYSKPSRVINFMCSYGTVSMYVFAIHGYFRRPFINWGLALNKEWGIYIFFLLYFIFIFVASVCIFKAYHYLKKLILVQRAH